MLKTLSSYFRSSTRINEFPGFLSSSKTLFNSSAAFNISEVIKLADLLNSNPKDYSSNIKLLMKGIKQAKDWVVHLKFMVILAYVMRNADKKLIPEVTSYLLSTIHRPARSKSSKRSDVETITDEVYDNILQNLRTYLLKACQDLKVYNSLYRQPQHNHHIPSYMLFKVINSCSYLFATRSTFSKLFKGFDISELFSTAFRFVAEEIAAWYKYYTGQLELLIVNCKEGEKEELGHIKELANQAHRLYGKVNLYMKMGEIYRIPIKIDSGIKLFKIPVEFKLSLQKSTRIPNNPLNHKQSNQRIRNVIKIESQQRSFAQDDFPGSKSIYKPKKSGRRHSLNNSLMIVHRSFKLD